MNTTFTKTDTLKVKAIAVILMLFHHLFYKNSYLNQFQIAVPKWLDVEQLTRMGTDARICVWIFVFLSTYGISLKLLTNKDEIPNAIILYKQWWALMRPYWFVYIVFFFVSFILPTSAYTFHDGQYTHIFADFMGCAELFGIELWMGSWWYMCFAQVLLIMLPLFVKFVNCVGVFSFPITFFIIKAIGAGFKSVYGGYYSNYLYTILLAIIFAKHNLFGRFGKRPRGFFCIIDAIGLFSAFYLFAHWKVELGNSVFSGIGTLLSAFSVVALCLFVQKYVSGSLLEKPIAYIGKHSGNIYLIHVAMYVYWPNIVFGTKTVLGSLGILLLMCLIVSVVLESLKKLLHYDDIVNELSTNILRWATKASP